MTGPDTRSGVRPRGGPATGRVTRWVGAAVLTSLLAVGLALCTLLPLPGDAPSEAFLRLDWRVRGEETGPCLRPTEEALDALSPHMRNPDACLGALPPYRLRVSIDGELRLDQEVRGGGAREDRPLTVYRELRLAPGERDLVAEFVRSDGEPGAIELRLSETIAAEAGRILLLVRRQDTGAFELKSPVP